MRNYVIRCKPKKNRYDGRLYVLMNGGSFSMSGYVTSFLQHHTDALMIGEETGGGDEGSNGMLFYMLTLPGSKIRVNVPYYHLTHQLPNVTSDRGVLPDIPVSYSVEDRLSGADLELKTALSEIRKYNTYNVTKEAGE
jgi:C-terminal processing protease CtpA/Prc